MSKETAYNVRIIDNGNGTYSLGHVSRFTTYKAPKDCIGRWVSGSRTKIIRLLTKGTLNTK